MKVGDFVRWDSRIVQDNGHLALTREQGVVVSVNGTAIDVVWSDGERCTHRANVLARTKGVMGGVVGDKRNPQRDRGKAPVHVPARIMPKPLPGPNPYNYGVSGVTLQWFLESEEFTVNKKGEKKPVMMKLSMRKVHVRDRRSGATWVYTGTRRNGAWQYSDSRVKSNGLKERSMTEAEFDHELAKYAVEPMRVWDGMKDAVMGPAEYKAIYGD